MTITIVGAGIAGAAFARCLKQRGIPSIIYEKAEKPGANAYGIHLRGPVYKTFLKCINISKQDFVNAVVAGDLANRTNDDDIWAHRGKLEAYLREGLDIRWSSEVSFVESRSENSGQRRPDILVNRKESLRSDFLVAADGEHSTLRKMLSENSGLTILPYVAYHGVRTLSQGDFETTYAPFIEKSTDEKLELLTDDGIRLVLEAVRDDRRSTILLRYTYSRRARENMQRDPLHRPTRDKISAKEIPEELFEEFDAMKDLAPPFNEAFDSKHARSDRVLHWLQRKSLLSSDDVEILSRQNIAMIGQAAHAEPILGGRGANQALEDAVALANHISLHGPQRVDLFYRDAEKGWVSAVAEAEERLGRLHSVS